MSRDYLRKEVHTESRLYHKDELVGVRVNIDGDLYDVDIDNYNCFLNTADILNGRMLKNRFFTRIELKYVGGYLVSAQDKKRIPELNYNDLCFLTGTLVENSSIHLKEMYDQINRDCFENELPHRVCINWSGDMVDYEYEVTQGVLNFRFVKGEPDNILHINLSYPLISSYPNIKEIGFNKVVSRRLFRIMYKIFKNDELTRLMPYHKDNIKSVLHSDIKLVSMLKEGSLKLSSKTVLNSSNVPEIEKSTYKPKWHKITESKTFYSVPSTVSQ